MTVLSRRPAGPFSPCARRLVRLMLAGALLAGPTLASANELRSCLVRGPQPAIEWTLVEVEAFIEGAADRDVEVAIDAPVADGSGESILALPSYDGVPDADVLTAGGGGAEFFGPSPAGSRSIFVNAWLPITIGELSLLCVTALLPKDWTGWSADFVSDGAGNFAEAWTRPPVWDNDHWFHNYVGHPYGGSFYYNAVRCQGASVTQSFIFSAALSAQWEYVFEAVAERPSIQDLVITPIAGAALGELTHRMAVRMEQRKASFPEKVLLTLLNPAHVLWKGYP